jgi:putative cell wall-binding protein
VVANGQDDKQGFDALSGNYLAGQIGAPILLTENGTLPAETATAVCATLKASGSAHPTVYVLGGTDSVSAAVAAKLAKPCTPALSGVSVVRIAGADRYATSAMIATHDFGPAGSAYPNAIGSFALGGTAPLRTAILASGETYADALAAGPISAQFHLPVLLTGSGALASPVAAAIKDLGIKQVIVLGGPDRVSTQARAALTALGIRIVTVAGADRAETTANLYALARKPIADGGMGQSGDTVALANGWAGFPDALAAGPYLGRNGYPLLLTQATTLPAVDRTFLTNQAAGLESVFALGREDRISDVVVNQAFTDIG